MGGESVGGRRAWKQLCMGSGFDRPDRPTSTAARSAGSDPKLAASLIEEPPQDDT